MNTKEHCLLKHRQQDVFVKHECPSNGPGYSTVTLTDVIELGTNRNPLNKKQCSLPHNTFGFMTTYMYSASMKSPHPNTKEKMYIACRILFQA